MGHSGSRSSDSGTREFDVTGRYLLTPWVSVGTPDGRWLPRSGALEL